jgi:high-affinity nickel-transport protein
VFLLTLAIVFSIPVFHDAFNEFQSIGSIVGTSVSVTFLWITAFMNLTALSSLLENKQPYHITSRGISTFIGKNIVNKIDQPNKMYFVGFLFGLGFDTATEVGLLGMTATASLHGLQPWLILLLPILFACGMVLTDSLDCILMSTVYNWPTEQKTKLRHYKIAIIVFITLAAFIVGLFELINMLGETGHWQNIMTHASQFLNDHSEKIGAIIILFFILLWMRQG